MVARDAQLALTLSVMVDASGKPGPVELVAPSDFPDYERAVLAAVERCRYVSALNGSTPVAQAVTLSLRREPGSQRP